MTDGSTPPPIELRVLGEVMVLREGTELEPLASQTKRLALLCYLALAEPQEPHGRDALVKIFWPGLEAGRGRAALRQSVYYLRKSVGRGVLTGKGDHEVGVNPERVVSDAGDFEAAVRSGDLEEAIGLYRGEFLTGLQVGEASPRWDEWVAGRRERYRREAVAAATGLAEEALRRGEPRRAAQWADRALQIEPQEARAEDVRKAAREAIREGSRRAGRSSRLRRLTPVLLGILVLAFVGWGAWVGFPASFGPGTDPNADSPPTAPFVEPQFGGLHDLRVVFDSTRDGNNEIYTMNADGTEPLRLTYDAARDVQPSWSPDDRTIAFVSDRDGNAEIYLMEADGSDVRRLTFDPGVDESPRFSPDGGRIAWASTRNGSLDLYVMDADGSNPRRVTDHPGDETNPAFSPDARRLVFQATIDAAGHPQGVDVYVVDLEGDGEPRRLNAPLTYDDEPDWSPDGSRIAFSSTRDGDWNREIYVMDADGSDETNLTRTPGMDWDPRWSPDGSTILFRSDRAGGPDLYVMDADGSNVRRVTRRGARRADWRGPVPRDPGCLVVNGSFEEVEEDHSPPDSDNFYGVPGWRTNEVLWITGGRANSPDIFVAPENVPQSLFGFQFPAHGRNYAGLKHGYTRGGVEGATETLGGALREPLRPGHAYEIRARFSTSETYGAVTIPKIDLFSTRTGAVMPVDTLRVDSELVWVSYRRRIEIAPDDTNAYDEIVFSGTSVNVDGYYFLDDVDVCPVD